MLGLLMLATISASCAELPAAVSTAPKGATIILSGDCPRNSELLLARREAPLTIDAGEHEVTGLRLVLVRNLTWRGGRLRAIGGTYGINRAGYGVTVEGSCDVVFEGATFTEALRGFVTIRPCEGLVAVRNSTFTALGADGVNLTDTVKGEVIGNRFFGFLPVHSQCWKDGVQIGPSPIARTTCEAMGGQWRDGTHADCVQMWNSDIARPLKDILVARNVIETPAPNECQALTLHGTKSAERIRFLDNVIRTDSAHGIAIANCRDCEVRGNRIEGITKPGEPYIMMRAELPNPGLVACGNTVKSTHPNKRQVGTRACS